MALPVPWAACHELCFEVLPTAAPHWSQTLMAMSWIRAARSFTFLPWHPLEGRLLVRSPLGLLLAAVVFPQGWTRKEPSRRRISPFRVSFATARTGLIRQLEQMRATDVRLDVDGDLRRDGLPLANTKEPTDPGVVVYWSRGGKKYALACDAWTDRASNMRAVELTLKAKRDVERWGAATAEAEYKGYEALPPPSGHATTPSTAMRPAWEVLGVRPGAHKAEIIAAFRRLAMEHHPDKGGSRIAWDEIVNARDALLGEAIA